MFQKLRRLRWILWGRLQIRRAIDRAAARGRVRVVLGASIINYDHWICTDLPHFDILKKGHWKFSFGGHQADILLAEHVFEHLTAEQVRTTLENCYQWLKPGGHLRIAVPDSYHPNPEYLRMTRPPADEHLSSWNIDSLRAMLESCGFRAEPLEYYSPDKKLVTRTFRIEDGPVRRSVQQGVVHPTIPDYSSLVVDAVKPAERK